MFSRKQKETHEYRDQTDGCQREGVLTGRGEEDEGVWQSQNRHEDVKYHVGNVVSNTGTTMYGAGGY